MAWRLDRALAVVLGDRSRIESRSDAPSAVISGESTPRAGRERRAGQRWSIVEATVRRSLSLTGFASGPYWASARSSRMTFVDSCPRPGVLGVERRFRRGHQQPEDQRHHRGDQAEALLDEILRIAAQMRLRQEAVGGRSPPAASEERTPEHDGRLSAGNPRSLSPRRSDLGPATAAGRDGLRPPEAPPRGDQDTRLRWGGRERMNRAGSTPQGSRRCRLGAGVFAEFLGRIVPPTAPTEIECLTVCPGSRYSRRRRRGCTDYGLRSTPVRSPEWPAACPGPIPGRKSPPGMGSGRVGFVW